MYEVIVSISWFYFLLVALVLFWFVLVQSWSHVRNMNMQEWISPGLIISVVEKTLSFSLTDDHLLFEIGYTIQLSPKGDKKWGGGGGAGFIFYQISRLRTKNEKACKILCQLQLPNINLPQSKHRKYNIPLLSLWWCEWFIFRGTGSYLLPPIPKHYNPRIFRVTGANQNIATDWSGK